MANRPPRLAWLGPGIGVALVAALVLGLWSGGSPKAPQDALVCWRMTGSERAPRFDRIAGDVVSLENCATLLEAEFLQSTRPVGGAYQGRFIFIDAEKVASADTLKGPRWRMFFDPQRAAIDDKLRTRAARRDAVRRATIPIAVAAPPAS